MTTNTKEVKPFALTTHTVKCNCCGFEQHHFFGHFVHIADYAKLEAENAELRAKLATPIKLPKPIVEYDDYAMVPETYWHKPSSIVTALRKQGFKVDCKSHIDID